jgi:hypothetical protein
LLKLVKNKKIFCTSPKEKNKFSYLKKLYFLFAKIPLVRVMNFIVGNDQVGVFVFKYEKKVFFNQRNKKNLEKKY